MEEARDGADLDSAWRASPPALSSTASTKAALAAVAALPAIEKYAALDISRNNGALKAIESISSLLKSYEMPSIIRELDLNMPKLAMAEFAPTLRIDAQLRAIAESFAPQRAILEAVSAAHLSQTMAFQEQISQIVSAQKSIGRLVADMHYSTKMQGLLETVSRYGQIQSHLTALMISEDAVQLLRGYTTKSGRRYDKYLDGLPARPIARRANVARQAGDAQTGLVVAESLTAPDLSPDDREDLTETFNSLVLEPWEAGPTKAREDLFEALAALEPDLPEWLKAAWDDIVRGGPKAASKIANCTVECVDRALRAAAPEGDVIAWLGTVPIRPGYTHNGRPTRRARVMFVMRHRPQRDADLAVAQVDALVDLVQGLVGNLQSAKHGQAPSIATMRSWVFATESALSQLFLHS